MQKKDRQNTILDLIGAKRIERQDELVGLLADRGYSVTQASVSRDLVELGVVKLHGAYAKPDHTRPSFGLDLISIDTAGPNMVVAKCPSGLASASAVRIDAAKIKEIVGTLAGDDTIFIAISDQRDQKKVIQDLRRLFVE